jgi:uncharacterized protein
LTSAGWGDTLWISSIDEIEGRAPSTCSRKGATVVRLLGVLARAIVRAPAAVLVALLLASVGFATLATTVQLEVDLTQFGRDDSEAVQAMDRVREDFGDPDAVVQVIVDAGRGGNVLDGEGLVALDDVESAVTRALGGDVRAGADGGAEVRTLPSTVRARAIERGGDPRELDGPGLASLVTEMIADDPQLAALTSDERDLEAGSARATVVVGLLQPGLDEQTRTAAARRVQVALEDVALPDGLEATVFSSGLFVDGLIESMRAELPLLFGLALLVVLAILALAYRSALDVVIGFVGLVLTVVWTFGIVSLLGPAHLGWQGPVSQLGVVVPVLLVGLGIDFAVHLTAAYRERRSAGADPTVAVRRSLHTVGPALVLATLATAAGFAANGAAPLEMVADFGVFVAVGVVCAFVVMGLGVPAARLLRDRGRESPGAGTVRELRLGRVMRAPVVLARRGPAVGLGVAAALAVASLIAATTLPTEFDRDQFVPEDSEVDATLALQQELFGGGVDESTFVVVDGDLTDPRVLEELTRAERRLGGIEGVRSVDGAPQIRSLGSLVERAVDGSEVPEANLAALYDRLRASMGPAQVEQVLASSDDAALVQIRTTGGDAEAGRLHREVDAAFAPLERTGSEVTTTSEPIIIGEMSDDLSAFQARAIAATLAIVLMLLTSYYGLARRRPMLGLLAMIPALVSASLLLGAMWLLGISFNVLTATMTAIAVGIGVPYGVHVANRFAAEVGEADPDAAVAATLTTTGGALTTSALTTLGAFVVLSLSDLAPIQELGRLGGLGIAFALLGAVLVQPGAMVLWSRRREGREGRIRTPGGAADGRPGATARAPAR